MQCIHEDSTYILQPLLSLLAAQISTLEQSPQRRRLTYNSLQVCKVADSSATSNEMYLNTSDQLETNISQYSIVENSTNLTRYTHPPTPSATASILASFRIAYIVVGIIGIIGNGLTFAVIITSKSLRKKLHNLFIINQCLVDIMLNIILFPTMLVTVTYTNVAICFLWQLRPFFAALSVSSIYSIVALAVERYLEVVFSIRHRLHVTRKKIIISMVAIWILAIMYKFATGAPATKFVDGICYVATQYPSNGVRVTMGAIILIVEYVSPLSIIIFCYVSMARSLRNKVHPQIAMTTSTLPQVEVKSLSRGERNVTKTLVIVIACFVVCTTYKQVVIFLLYAGIDGVSPTSVGFNVAQLMSSASTCIYPYIYLASHNEFNKGVRKLFRQGGRVESGGGKGTRASAI
jgi:hypothetical protein